MTRIVGRSAHCSASNASSCSANAAATSVPKSAAPSPRSRLTIEFLLGLDDGSRTRSASSSGSSGKACPSSSPAPQNTSQPMLATSAIAARTRDDLPMPGSPSSNTEPPRPSASSVTPVTSIASSGSRPTSAPAEVAVGTQRTLLPEHKGNKRCFWTKIINFIVLRTTITPRLFECRKMQVSRHLSAQAAAHIPSHEEMNFSDHQSLPVLSAISVYKICYRSGMESVW